MKQVVFAFDFSCNKPAMTCCIDGSIGLYVWPSEIDKVSLGRLVDCDVCVIDRQLDSIKDKNLNQHQLINEHVHRAVNLADLIVSTINNIVNENNINKDDVIVSNEGFAFSSKGNATLDLAGYKYILMERLIENGYTNLRTYSPKTIKKTAGCSKKGLGKDAMIEAIKTQDDKHKLFTTLRENDSFLKKKSNYVLCMDDIADSYWDMKTCMKETNG